jgi:rhodanese-related sulfurtransferase/glyoxylase-like metal-dependent hydrolase (beta-lactamase superfamily II)
MFFCSLNKLLLLFFILLLPLTSFAEEKEKKSISTKDTALEAINKRINNIDTKTLKALVEKEKNLVLIDVRIPAEIDLLGGEIHTQRNINIPRGWLEFRVEDAVINKDTPIVVYCGTNQRSPLAADTLMKLGYSNVKNYADGITGWIDAGYPVVKNDNESESMLYNKPTKIAEGVYSAIGQTAPATYANSGHNNNLSFIVSDDGVLVVYAGDNYLLAKALHEEIKKVTDQKVKHVVLENAQGHAMLGMSYWQEQGANIIAHSDAAEEIETEGEAVLERMIKGRKDKSQGTVLSKPDQIFDDKLEISLGKIKIEILHLGAAHSPGDISVWLPEQKIIIAGDMAFNKRLLPLFEHTDSAAWISETWDNFVALKPSIVIPGHGPATTLDVVTRYTKDYLVYMRSKVDDILENDGELSDAYKIDQSAYAEFDTFKYLAQRNADLLFRSMEME